MKRPLHKLGRYTPLTRFSFSSGIKPVKKHVHIPAIPWYADIISTLEDAGVTMDPISDRIFVSVRVNKEHLIKMSFAVHHYNDLWPVERLNEIKKRIRNQDFEEIKENKDD